MKRKKRLAALLLCMLLVLTACSGGAAKEDPAPAPAAAPAAETAYRIPFRFADREEGQKLLLSHTEYYEGLTLNDLQFRMQSKEATLEEYLAFSKEQVLDFSDEQKAKIDAVMRRIEEIIAQKRYRLPPLGEITFVCTTMEEEPGASAYTHGNEIYIGSADLDMFFHESGRNPFDVYLMAHELFHCLTRCHPEFRADMYQLIHFTVQEKEYALPPSVLEHYISNPDVEHHDAYASFEIDGEMTDCYMAFATRKHFERPGDTFFDTGTAVLIPIDGSDRWYHPGDAANFNEIVGENTDYTIDPEECMADNFGFLFAFDRAGQFGLGYKTPEIIDGIRDYLQKERQAP